MNINIGKSIKKAKALTGKSNVFIARKICITPTYLGVISKKKHCSTELVAKLAAAYDYNVIDFIKLGMSS